MGFATSKSPTHVGWAGRPVPSRLAEIDEIRALAGALGEAGGGILQATLGRGLFFDEFDQIAAETGRPISWTALLAGAMGPGSHRGVLARAAQQQREGRRVIPQVSCRPLNFEFQWKEPFPFESMKVFAPDLDAPISQGKLRIYRDPEFRRAFRESTETGFGRALSAWWERTWIASAPSEPGLAERPLAEVARERGVHPLDLALDLGIASQLDARFRMAIMNFDEDEVAELLLAPHTVLGLSDAGAHASQLCDACFSTHLLGHWVREKATLRLEQAVHMLTARPAEVFGLTDRGRLAVGLPADVVVFDAARVGASPLRRVHDQPAGADRLVSDADRHRRRDRRRDVDPARRKGRRRSRRPPARPPAAPRTARAPEDAPHHPPRRATRSARRPPSATRRTSPSAVAAGLSLPEKSLPCRFLYDARGSRLFEAICELPEYYLTRAEHEILVARAGAIAARFDEPATLAELGSGSARKTRLLIEAFLSRHGALRYVPIDISRSALAASAREPARALPGPRGPRDRERVPRGRAPAARR